jgi:hypothetical protein
MESQSIPIHSPKMLSRRSVPIESHFGISVIQVSSIERNSLCPRQQLMTESQSNDTNQNIDKSQSYKCFREMTSESEDADYIVKPRWKSVKMSKMPNHKQYPYSAESQTTSIRSTKMHTHADPRECELIGFLPLYGSLQMAAEVWSTSPQINSLHHLLYFHPEGQSPRIPIPDFPFSSLFDRPHQFLIATPSSVSFLLSVYVDNLHILDFAASRERY